MLHGTRQKGATIMKLTKRLLSVLLCAALLLSMAACGGNGQETTQGTTVPPTTVTEPPVTEPSAADLYAQAAAPLREKQDMTLEVTIRETLTAGPDKQNTTFTQNLAFFGTGTDDPRITLTETISGEGEDDKFEEYYAAGTLYVTVYDEYQFKGAKEYEEYAAQFAPAVLLDETLYGSIKAVEGDTGTVYIFDDPSGPESWAMPEGAVYEDASGSATVSSDGKLVKSVYNISYSFGGIGYQMQYTVVPGEAPQTAPVLSGSADDSRELACIDAPRIYDMAVLYLCGTLSASSDTTETITSEAAGAVRVQQTGTDLYIAGGDYCYGVDIDVAVYSGNSTSTYTQSERFQDQKYTFSADGSDPVENSSVDAGAMYSYCLDYLVENVIALDYLESADMTYAGGIVYLELGFSDEFGAFMDQYASGILFNDGSFLDNLASSYKTTECSGYLAVNGLTCFPTAIGLTYSGTHTIDGSSYHLSLQADQMLEVASTTAYENITGEPLPETEPEEKAAPLFYHVTGSSGQEMWLLGTIHVGDARTAYLPQEIYDAFSASDALALEFDSGAFDQQIETDAALQKALGEAYYYSDGSKTADHLDPEVYEAALLLMKASGNYSINAEYLKPSIWSSSIENFYLRQGYGLTNSQGVESRLEKLAAEQNKKILDVESGLFQLQMLTGFSDEVQEMLLAGSVDSSIAGYTASVMELYELWCQGDEAALREALQDDLSEATEEELVLYAEYNKAMSTDRNEGMLNVAINYLESGDVVFYAVGLAHLLDATNGLVDALRDAGYTVELVSYE